tara:strand:- start:1236 stop:1409 length:174 start_codon:yes stop_codon:yes gene_type:complete
VKEEFKQNVETSIILRTKMMPFNDSSLLKTLNNLVWERIKYTKQAKNNENKIDIIIR